MSHHDITWKYRLQGCNGKGGVDNINHSQISLDLDFAKTVACSSAYFLPLWGEVRVVSQLGTSKGKRKLPQGSLPLSIFLKCAFYTKQEITSWENAEDISRHISQKVIIGLPKIMSIIFNKINLFFTGLHLKTCDFFFFFSYICIVWLYHLILNKTK